MLILGNKYTFTDLELKRLTKKFSSIKHISYKDEDPQVVIADIEDIFSKNSYPVVVLNTKATLDDSIIRYLTNLQFKNSNITIIAIEHFLEKYLHKCYIPEDNNDFHCLDNIKGYTFFQTLQKKGVDYLSVSVLLMMFPFIKYVVKKKIDKQSPGSLYFHQARVGCNNKDFECIKFRSMHEHDSENDVRTATKEDDRKFPWGESMRRMRIDELPQIFNILKGEVHLIGPRAEWNKLTQEYEKEIPYYNQRHVVAPGITGWAQVMFVEGRSKDDTRQKLMYDLYYIKNWSLLLELKIIYKTIVVVLSKRGI
ncbi:sugar transferase [Sulfurimonas sp. SAG-AH-194-L11]|nr:sugar transferase [Sulfurimonas sp. SAG-AH-194-L11]MDF1876648.1 sugar transferase [Sulfurimonas sp. SAG-AH-194-L11]